MPSYNIQDGNAGFKRFKTVGEGTTNDPYVQVVGIQVVPDVDTNTNWGSPLTNTNVASEKLIKETIDNKEITTASFTANDGVLTLNKSDGDITVDLNLENSSTLSNITSAGSGSIISSAERTKLTNIETNADVTDAANVDVAGAVMNTDTTTADMNFVVDEDNMSSDSNSKIPTQQSVKAYVDAEISSALSSEMTYKGAYNATTNIPDLDTSPSGIKIGDTYTVTNAGQFYTENLSVGDVLISETDNASSLSHWTIVGKGSDASEIKTLYESNSDTNAYSDSEQTKLGHISVTQAIDLDQLNAIPLAPTDNEVTNTYFYFGWSSKNGGWLVRRQTRTSGLLERADVSNNSTVTAYTDAWNGRVTLNYGSV